MNIEQSCASLMLDDVLRTFRYCRISGTDMRRRARRKRSPVNVNEELRGSRIGFVYKTETPNPHELGPYQESRRFKVEGRREALPARPQRWSRLQAVLLGAGLAGAGDEDRHIIRILESLAEISQPQRAAQSPSCAGVSSSAQNPGTPS
ncbi:hypothetical protein E2C01_005456 [Portunus trituberculatus]|uniref:Uncharacterized protein n=1 Tax=Portunus trituberculatus TaxID=210409 RepID=A0A5B7CTJ4_PORTR|nr:hypothetical protein [Portunus trituberculatus]